MDVSHRVDSSFWSTTIRGQMRYAGTKATEIARHMEELASDELDVGTEEALPTLAAAKEEKSNQIAVELEEEIDAYVAGAFGANENDDG